MIHKLKLLPLFLFFIPWCLYFGYIWLHAIQVTPNSWLAAYIPHWGDGIAHLSYMASFAYRTAFPQEHPLFIGHPFTYSFAADMIGGLMSKLGLPLWFAYNLWGLLLSLAVLVGLWWLIKTLTQSSWLTLVALNLFLLSGGFGFRYLATDYLFPETKPAESYFFSLLTQRENSNIVWLNVIVGELIPQRALLLALPLGALLMTIWYRRFICRQQISRWWLLISGIVLGCMPVIHPHTTMFIVSCLGLWSLYDLSHHRTKSSIFDLVAIGIPTIIIGGYLTLTFLTPSVSSGFFKWYPGWIALSKKTNWLLFWLDNWGLFLPLALIGTIMYRQSRLIFVLIPAWVWFILTNLFLFQPYDWDNSKLLTWVYLIFTIPVVQLVANLWQRHLGFKLLSVFLVCIVTFSGAVDAFKMLDVRTFRLEIVNKEELQLAEFVRTHTDPGSVILTSTTHRNWVSILTGRQILCGYLGWMWTYGIKADDRVADIRTLFAGSSQTEQLLQKYGIDYVVIGPEEKNEFTVNESYFAARYPVLIQTPSTTVYQIN